MEGLVKELEDLLSKYGITLQEAARIYEKHQKQSKRLIQCHKDTENPWQYYTGEGKNPCGCGSNCFHYEYDKVLNKIYGVCNCCNTDIYEVKEEYIKEKLSTGKWLSM